MAALLSQPMAADKYTSQHCQELVERLDTLRRNENLCDVTIAVKGKEFKAHRVVLAAVSQFFLSLLESNMRESNEQLIRIELEEATASVMEDVLKYVYTGNVSVTEEGAHNLIATADYLLLPGLKTLACDFLIEAVTLENCVFNYYFADKYQCVELKKKSMDVINLNFSVVMETDDFLNLSFKQVVEWVCSDDVTISAEEEVFMGIVKWVSHNKTEREKDFPDLLHQVRLHSMSHDFVLKELVKEELVTTNIECVNFVLKSMEGMFSSTGECATKPSRKCLETCTDGIFVCGGKISCCYLPNENEWYWLADMMLGHQNHAAVQYRGKVYTFSTQNCEDFGMTADYYMPSTNSWGTIRTKIEYANSKICSLLVLNGNTALYALADDVDREFGCVNAMFLFYPDKNEWQLIKGLLTCWGSCGVTDGCHLYVIGGSDEDDEEITGTSKVVRYDPSGSSWEEVAGMNEGRHDAFGAAMNGKIYVAGGMQRQDQICTVLNTCEVYDPSTNEWQLIPSLNVSRHSASMVCFHGALYVVGGLKDEDESRELSVEMFDSKTSEWKKKASIPVDIIEDQEEAAKNYHNKACVATINKYELYNRVELFR